MERYEPPQDPNNEPTQLANAVGGSSNDAYSAPESYYSEYRQPPERIEPPEPAEPPPTPWYLRPVAIVGWGVLSAILITVLVWSMVRLMGKGSDHTPPPASTSVSSTVTSPGAPATEPTAATSQAPDNGTAPAGPAPSSATEAPTTTEAPASTETSTAAPSTSTQTQTPTTTAAPTSTEAPASSAAPTSSAPAPSSRPSEIVIPLPPGL
ncbi:hypothetical protein KIH27_03090 [Mycobacterium sp. M1]|uniref:Uncharacterized protein n=1 Tax=Mycolicibacter acidiphilus TaxID=2835306 RepID=A0ABS5RFY2_9MYCO|nr:hypothetical protein [Mycolicibacter acidiphilus]MBS9532569.1 hypothetical protein [Mycolicibacter acidiphilus]